MPRNPLDWSVFKDLSWWHWALTVPLLAISIIGDSWAPWTAIGLCILVGGYFWMRLKRLRPYPVQVRLAYLGLLLSGALPGMKWVYWVPLIGTTAMVLVGYCPLLRTLSVAPWNRSEPLSAGLLRQVFLQAPCAGGLMRWASTSSSFASACGLATESPGPIDCSFRTDSCGSKSIQEDQHAHAH